MVYIWYGEKKRVNINIVFPAILVFSVFFSLIQAFLLRTTVYAQEVDISPPSGLALPPQAVPANNVVQFIINMLVIIGVIAALAFLIYGGIKWITSGGDKGGVESARNSIIAAILGLVVIILAWVILNVVFQLVGLGGFSTVLRLPTLVNPTV